ncbi:MAG: hypothetical protein WCC66_02420 [Rhizobiaceae bacterium]
MPVSTVVLWIKLASASMIIALGALFALGAYPPTAAFADLFVDLLKWPLDGAQTVAAQEARIIAAIGGGITVGWGVMIWQIASRILPTDPALGRQLLTTSMLSWFVIDSTASWLAGVPLNVALNTALLALFLVPLWRMEGGSKSTVQLPLV